MLRVVPVAIDDVGGIFRPTRAPKMVSVEHRQGAPSITPWVESLPVLLRGSANATLTKTPYRTDCQVITIILTAKEFSLARWRALHLVVTTVNIRCEHVNSLDGYVKYYKSLAISLSRPF